MKKLILIFIKVNQSFCEKLVVLYPKIFGTREDARSDFFRLVTADIEKNNRLRILEVGGIDRPVLSPGNRFTYIGLDIEDRPKCREVYDHFLVQSVEDKVDQEVDIVFSMTLLEHVKNNSRSINSIYRCLSVGGFTAHYLPSKFHPYSMILRVIGNKAQRILIRLLRPEHSPISGYPVFFDRCSPEEMRANFESVGFRDVQIIPYYRATDYFSFFVPAFIVVWFFEKFCERLNLRVGCAGFIIMGYK